MSDGHKFNFGDEVKVIVGHHSGRAGCVSINPSGTYTVEFGDGSDAEIEDAFLLGLEVDE